MLTTADQTKVAASFLVRNYNRFLVRTNSGIHWEDLHTHRDQYSLKKLALFNSEEEARTHLKNHPELESDFDAWVIKIDLDDWE